MIAGDIDVPEENDPGPRANDPAFLAACTDLTRFFHEEHPKELFYDRQLCVLFEKKYFHWITGRALKTLVDERRLATDLEVIPGVHDEEGRALTLRFYRHPSHRYWRTQGKEIAGLVRQFSGDFGHALGDYGELVCDAALGAEGFVRAAKNTREWQGRRWDKTGHNLDRIYVRDGIAYGCEIKNTLKYLPVEEREVKQAICGHLGVKPLFIVRWLPKSHMHEIIEAGGFAILFEHQLYPIGQGDLANEVRKRLWLPVVCSGEFPADAVDRFVRLHQRLGSEKGSPHDGSR